MPALHLSAGEKPSSLFTNAKGVFWCLASTFWDAFWKMFSWPYGELRQPSCVRGASYPYFKISQSTNLLGVKQRNESRYLHRVWGQESALIIAPIRESDSDVNWVRRWWWGLLPQSNSLVFPPVSKSGSSVCYSLLFLLFDNPVQKLASWEFLHIIKYVLYLCLRNMISSLSCCNNMRTKITYDWLLANRTCKRIFKRLHLSCAATSSAACLSASFWRCSACRSLSFCMSACRERW